MNVRRRVFLFINFSRLILLILTAIIILILPQLNWHEYASGTISGKLIFFMYISMVLMVFYTGIILFSRQILFSFSKIDITLLVLVLYITLNRYYIHTGYGFSTRYLELLGLCFFYIVLRCINLKYFPLLLLSVIMSAVFQAVYGNLQLLGFYSSNHSGFKMTGSFFNPGPYAGFLAITWAISLGMYLFKENVILEMETQLKSKVAFCTRFQNFIFKYIPLAGLISIIVVLPALQSRASWIVILVSTLILLEFKYNFFKNILKKGTVRSPKTLVLSAISVILIFGLFSLYNYKKASSDGRIFIWKITTQIVCDTPVFGVGFDQFKAHYMNYQASYFAHNGETNEIYVADNTFYAFNEWLQFLAENGLIGFMLLMIMLFILFKTKAEKTSVVNVLILKTALLGIGIFACFSYPMQILPIKTTLFILLAMLSNNAIASFQIKTMVASKRTGLYKIAIFLLTCSAICQTFIYTTNLRKGFIAWNNALHIYEFGNYSKALHEFELAYPVFEKNGDFLMNYGKALAMAGKSSKAIAVLEQANKYQNNTITATALGDSYKAKSQFSKAEKAYVQAIHMAPGKFYGYYLLAKLYDESGRGNRAVALAKKLIHKEIKIPSSAIKEMQGEMKKIIMKHDSPLSSEN